MILDSLELRELYEGVIKPFEHPDPIGFVTRALLMSEGDDQYIGEDGRFGFMPMTSEQGREVGVNDVFSLENNVTAALAYDRVKHDELGNINDMIKTFHFPDDELSKNESFIDEVDESRSDTYSIMYPRFATRKDVIELLTEASDPNKLTKQEKEFFDYLTDKG